MNINSATKRPFPLAAIFFILYGSVRFFTQIYDYINYIFSSHYSIGILEIISDTFAEFHALSFIVFGIILLATKRCLSGLLVPLFINVGYELYNFGLDLYYNIEYGLPLRGFIGYFLLFAALVLFIIFIICSRKAKENKCSLLVVWFIPGITTFAAYLIFNYYRIIDLFFNDYLIYYPITLILNLFAIFILLIPSYFLFGYWLYKENKYKALGAAPMTIPSYEADNTQSAYTPAQNNNFYTPACSSPTQQNYPQYNAPAYNQQYTQPVQQPYANQMHATDEISRYKKLLDEGAITQEEYDAKKKQLLGL